MNEVVKPKNFIRNIIDQDIASNKHARIVTRFPPEPNGYLHIGHAKSICLNFGIAIDYLGDCYLRFDDTNPSKEETEYINSIMADVHWLGFDWGDRLRYASHYFETLYDFAIELIQHNKAYVCKLSPDETREYRGTLTQPGKSSPYRDQSVSDNLDLFKRMRAGEFKEGEYVLRAKIDMASSNMNLRDPVIYRIMHAEHHQTEGKWCIYPMYDYAHPISDAIEGITHSICTLEFEDHRPLYDWVLDNISVPCHPRQIEFSRLNLEYTITSKRKLNTLVSKCHVKGWDDPRMPTIAGLRRRGYSAASIRDFCDRIGVTKVENTIEMSVLENCIREDLGSHAPRVLGVLDPLKIVIENYPEDKVEMVDAPNHPQDPSMGTRQLPFSREIYIDKKDFRECANKKYKRLVLDKEVRLRHAYIIKCHEAIKNDSGDIIELRCTYDEATLGMNPEDRKVKGVIHWVSAKHAVQAEVRLYDRLFTVPEPGAAEDFEATINPESLVILKECQVEPVLQQAQALTAFQFEREGYFCLDSVDSSVENLVFNRVVTLRDSWVKIENKINANDPS